MSDIKTQKLKVTGMTCGHCVMNVENKLKAAPGVESATADKDANSPVVTYDADQASPEDLLAALADTNYKASIEE